MARRATACHHPGGGAHISALRPPSARVVTSTGAVLFTVILAAAPVLRAYSAQGILAALGLLAVGSVAMGCGFLRASGVRVALLALGGEYVVLLTTAPWPLDVWAAVYAAGLFLMSELAHWALEQRWPVRLDPGSTVQRLAFIGRMLLATVALGSVLLALAELPFQGSLPLLALAVLATLGSLTLVGRLAWRAHHA